MQQLEERRAVPLQVLAVSGQPLVVSMTLPRFPFAKTGSPFATGGPRVRILLPPAASQERTPSSKTAISSGTCRRRRRSEQSRFTVNARMRPSGGRQDGGSRSAIGSAVAGTAWLDAVREC
jgi:hypothetical protein